MPYPTAPPCSAFRRKCGAGPYVIAEIGVNHGGDIELAERLIDEAKNGGADCVKFQTYKAGRLASKHSPAYWDRNAEPTTSQYELFGKYDGFGPEEYQRLARHAATRDVDFCSTPFDLDAVDMLAELLPFFKIASADITNTPLLEACAAHGKPVLLSTGASNVGEIEAAVQTLRQHLPAERIGILHCVLSYPTDYSNAHLAAIEHLAAIFPEHPIGYSDHTRPDPGMLVLLRSFMLGAVIVEKHFTHDKSLPGNDHYHAMDQEDLRRFRESLELLLTVEGQAQKRVLDVESQARRHARRSLVAARDLERGTRLKPEDLSIKRPAHGLPPEALGWVLGHRLTRDLAEDEFLTYEHVLDA